MNQFLERLPWRLAAFAGLLVGGVSWASGADLWDCLLRVGAAFFFFWLLGRGLCVVMQQGRPPSSLGRGDDHRGRHLDATIPEMRVEDIKSGSAESRSNPGDENE